MIAVQVRGELGDVIIRGWCQISWSSLQGIDEEEFPHLGGLLPYAGTMFNARQVLKVRREIRDNGIGELLGSEVVGELERLCRAVADGPHRYLLFLGDLRSEG